MVTELMKHPVHPRRLHHGWHIIWHKVIAAHGLVAVLKSHRIISRLTKVAQYFCYKVIGLSTC